MYKSIKKMKHIGTKIFYANVQLYLKVKFLQETVQKEVEERFELTEALSTARTELLKLKKPSGILGHLFFTRVAYSKLIYVIKSYCE